MTTGDPIPESSKSEVIDLSDPNSICDPLPNYPLGMASGFGGLVDGNTPLLCSGFSESQFENYVHEECFTFSEGEWKLIGKVNFGRWYGGSVVLDNSVLWLTGGTNMAVPFKSTEYVSADGTITLGPNMPEPIDEHCSVNLDQGRSMLITGIYLPNL